MNANLRDLITDLKAAARIGHPESLALALDAARALPEIAGNHPLKEAFLVQAILPIGEVLASPRVPLAILRSMSNEALAGMRGIAAVAMSIRLLHNGGDLPEELKRLGRDPRPGVRTALALALSKAGAELPNKLMALTAEWLVDTSPRLRQTALLALASLNVIHGEAALAQAASLSADPDPEVRAALVDCLTALARQEQAELVLRLLADWAGGSDPNQWVIARTLSASWAAEHADESLEILRALAAQGGPARNLVNALNALSRHGAEESVQAAMRKWKDAPNANVNGIAERQLSPPTS